MDSEAGIVLAGGQSSRMGTSKALLRYNDVPLVEHMQGLLRDAGLADVYISGDIPGYDCIPDAVRHDGPARAMYDLLRRFKGRYDRLLFVPVDMPLIDSSSLRTLLAQQGSVYYESFPLPACLETGDQAGDFHSVRDLLLGWQARPVQYLSGKPEHMVNVNTQQEWEKISS